jgi:4'-phosphopantetheinyl transferase
MIRIALVKLPEVADKQLIASASALLPEAMQREVESFVQPMDQARSAFGKLLIHRFLAPESDPSSGLAHWTTDLYGRPSLPGKPPFNLTHSGLIVGLAFAENAGSPTLGLDIECIKSLDLELYGPYMNEREWAEIREAEHPETRFFHYWTAKEAVMKAEGLGFHLPIHEIDVRIDSARVRGRLWKLFRPDLGSELGTRYAIHLAAASGQAADSVEWLDAETLLP